MRWMLVVLLAGCGVGGGTSTGGSCSIAAGMDCCPSEVDLDRELDAYCAQFQPSSIRRVPLPGDIDRWECLAQSNRIGAPPEGDVLRFYEVSVDSGVVLAHGNPGGPTICDAATGEVLARCDIDPMNAACL